MVKRWQVERMALCFLSSSHKQTGENLELSPSFPRGSVNNYHCRDRREKTLDEVFEGAGQNYSHTSLCCQLCLRSPPVPHGWAFPSWSLSHTPELFLRFRGLSALLAVLGLQGLEVPADFPMPRLPSSSPAGWEKPSRCSRVPVTCRSWRSTGCAGAAEPRHRRQSSSQGCRDSQPRGDFPLQRGFAGGASPSLGLTASWSSRCRCPQQGDWNCDL